MNHINITSRLAICLALIPIPSKADFTSADWQRVGVYTSDTDVPIGYNGYRSLAIAEDGHPIVAGGFTSLGGQPVKAVAKWNGTNWHSLGAGLAFDGITSTQVAAGNLTSDGTNLYVSGMFRLPGEGAIGRYLAWWDGSTWHYDDYEWSGNPGIRASGIRRIVKGNGIIYAVGQFKLSNANNDYANCIASFSPVLGWRKLGQLAYGEDVTEMVFDGQDLYVSGDFTSIIGSPTYTGSVPANKIAKWNGLYWSALGEGFLKRPEALVIHQGHLIASGPFEQTGGGGIRNLARWDGQNWSEYAGGMPLSDGVSSWGPPPVYIRTYALSMASDGQRLWVGGAFSYLDGHPSNSVNYWDGSAWTRLPGGPSVSYGGAAHLTLFQNQLYCLEGEGGSKHVFRADLSGLTASPFAQAATAAGLSGANAQPLATPFQDGVPNLLKFAFNLSLSGPDSRELPAGGTAGLPLVTRVDASGDTPPKLRIEYLRRIGAGLNYVAETTNSLTDETWVAIPGQAQVTPVSSGWERIIHEQPADSSRLFGRVRVTAQP